MSDTTTSSTTSVTTSSETTSTTVEVKDGAVFVNGHLIQNVDPSHGITVTSTNGVTTVNGQPVTSEHTDGNASATNQAVAQSQAVIHTSTSDAGNVDLSSLDALLASFHVPDATHLFPLDHAGLGDSAHGATTEDWFMI